MKSFFLTAALFISAHAFCQFTPIPDLNFESTLIVQGYDTLPLDGQVPTANINSLTLLDVSSKNISDLSGIEDFTALQDLDLGANNLTSLDLSQNVNLQRVWTPHNPLTCINIQNGNNENIILFHTLNCPNLVCIQVDDSVYSDTTWIDGSGSPMIAYTFNSTLTFSEYCDVCNVGLDDLIESYPSIYPNPASEYFKVDGLNGNFDVSIFNSMGQLLYSRKNALGSERFNIDDFDDGVLLVRIKQQDHLFHRRVLKGM